MKRRGFFRFLGLAAVAAPLAGVVGTAEAKADGTFLPAGDVHLDSYWKGWDDGAERSPLTFEAQQADCAARGCSITENPGLSGYVVVHGHPDLPAPWPTFGPHAVFFSPLTSAGLANVDAWRRGLHAPAYPFVRRADEDHTATYSNIVETEPRL